MVSPKLYGAECREEAHRESSSRLECTHAQAMCQPLES